MNTQFQDLVNNIPQDCSRNTQANVSLRKMLLLCFRMKDYQFTEEQNQTIYNIMEQLNDFAVQNTNQREDQQRKINRCIDY
tara:strand:- start:356 stop:598 length:243 start_codon:yes stop_codon:yes gene_type:complete